MRRPRVDNDHAANESSHQGAPARNAAHVASGYLFIGLLAVVAGLLLGLLAARPPAPKSATAAPEQFSAENVLPLMLRLLGDSKPHPIGTEANAEMRARLITELEALGLEVTTQEAFACREQWFVCGHVVNVMTRLPAETGGPAVMLTAHYDSVGAGPGVSDDLAGVAAILETARLLLAEGPLRNPLILLFTDGEEASLLGAEAFVEHPWFADVGVVINLEARGSSGQSMLFETSEDNTWLIESFAERAPSPVANSLLYELYRLLPNDTDFSVYKDAGLAGINFAYSDEIAHYHTPLDDLEHLNRSSLQHHGDNVLAAARAFGSMDLTDPPAGSSIYVDLVPGSIVQLPAGWAAPLAVVGLLLWTAMIVVLIRRRVLDWPGVGLGLLATVLALAFAGALGAGVLEVIAALTGRGSFFYADPLPTRAAIWLAALLGVLLAAVPFARRAGFWGLSAGVWLLWGLASLASAVALPGASVFFLVPMLAAVVAYGLAVLTPLWRSVWAGPLAAGLVAFATAYLWLPFVLAIESGLGLDLAAAIAICAALAFSAFMPVVAQPVGHGRGRGVLMLSTLAAVIVTGAMAANAENFSELRPQRLSLLHLQLAEEGQLTQAWWLVDAFPPASLTEELAAEATFVRDDSIRLPWSRTTFLSADAPALDATPPGIAVVSDEATGGARTLTLQLSSPRGAPRVVLTIPAGSGLESITVAGTSYVMPVAGVEVASGGAGEGTGGEAGLGTAFTCHGAQCDGTTIELLFDTSAPLSVTIGDLSYGLPPVGAALQEARPENAVASQDGDVSVVLNSVTLPPP